MTTPLRSHAKPVDLRALGRAAGLFILSSLAMVAIAMIPLGLIDGGPRGALGLMWIVGLPIAATATLGFVCVAVLFRVFGRVGHSRAIQLLVSVAIGVAVLCAVAGLLTDVAFDVSSWFGIWLAFAILTSIAIVPAAHALRIAFGFSR